MTICTNCKTVEPETRLMTAAEKRQCYLDEYADDEICAVCESLEETLQNVNEDKGAER